MEAGPEEAVVDDEEVSTCGDGFAHDGEGRVHGCDDLGDFAFAVFELEAVEGIGVVGDLCDAQFGVEMGDEVGEIHGGSLGCLERFAKLISGRASLGMFGLPQST